MIEQNTIGVEAGGCAAPGDADPAHQRVADIDEDQVGRSRWTLASASSASAGLGGDDQLTRPCQLLAHRAAGERVAVDQDDPHGLVVGQPLRRADSAGSAGGSKVVDMQAGSYATPTGRWWGKCGHGR